MQIKKIGYAILDYTTRTWIGFWCTLLFTIVYCTVNLLVEKSFDPYPFMFLTMVITMFSYYQNIIIMTIQREDHEIQMALEQAAKDKEQKEYDMIEDIYEEVVEHKDELHGN
jgi:uncharacterized membrane protein